MENEGLTANDVIHALIAAVKQGAITGETPVQLVLEKSGKTFPLEQFGFYSTEGKVDLIGELLEEE